MDIRKICRKILIYVLPLILVLFFSLYHASENCTPKIFGDEYGYWAAGAFFAGIDWDDITSLNPYYGWGYGLILSIILRFPISASDCYILAIGLNGIFVFLIYCIARNIAMNLFENWNPYAISVIAFCAAILPSNLYYTQYTLCEVILTLFYWIDVYLIWKIIENNSIIKDLLLIFVNFCLFCIHMRTIGIVLVSVCFLVIILKTTKNNNIKNLFVFLVFSIFCLIITIAIKKIYQTSHINLYANANNVNDFSGQVWKIKEFFTFDGFKSFCISFIGKIYSTMVNSYMFVMIAVLFGIATFIKNGKNDVSLKTEYFLFICLLNLLVQMGTSALALIAGIDTRFDLLTYGRYHEFTVGVLILLGIYYISIYNNIYEKFVIILICSLFILTKIIMLLQNYNSPLSHVFLQSPLLYFCIEHSGDIHNVYFEMLLINTVVLLLSFLCFKYNKKITLIFVCFILIIFNIYQSNYTLENGCFTWSIQEQEDNLETKVYIEQNNYEDDLIFLADDNILRIEGMQYLLKEHSIHIADKNALDQVLEKIVMSSKNYDSQNLLNARFLAIYEKGDLILWKRQ